MKSLASMLQGGSISAAVGAVENEIKARPADADLRATLVQLLCLSGNWQRANAQLKSWQALKPIAQPTTLLLMQSVNAELQRQAVFAGNATPALLQQNQPWLQQMLQALRLDAQGETGQAQALRDSALEAAPASAGQLTLAQGEQAQSLAFEWLTDGDGRLGPVCELALNGAYYWLPFADIAEIQFQAPQSAIDLVWSHALVRLRDGREQVCQLPARYPLAENSDDALLLGQRTAWLPLGDGPHYAGLGLKTWLSESDEFPLHSLRQLSFGAGA
ncbi:type VI secretion system accessory protein TagJ [Serratia entomophila]|uniref:type VI secretion system accessory protein TagJ n=1 Tax=Serratia entomophila TaxID=42906 RepID=UPI00217800EC|nr:type VI secretion system accessory protein TagJ [Serratia entomophila]CAI0743466.1 Protein of avirulence locus involved in temperature-dependent protein secretion [Serratia entomophila]CAI0744588.1 Protein of avirulence locus involved in temperature-dependent protein secretion [Serratia entomophila]CAI0745180.1 Protein of avirulence locus involved in temperature-dependent protein secretion [Serratia entomophila]CAI0834469.1 Protein of avirulence locus involved in temperature-dependent protei